ncbi:hypothetical protein JTB14_028687 [Gonioctena quinquepunctata]|nr:hypothetical protein JTB14_028687 [Gonioctena quinquepunctata]
MSQLAPSAVLSTFGAAEYNIVTIDGTINGAKRIEIMDTGAERNVISKEVVEGQTMYKSTWKSLLAVGNKRIPTLGEVDIYLGIGNLETQ